MDRSRVFDTEPGVAVYRCIACLIFEHLYGTGWGCMEGACLECACLEECVCTSSLYQPFQPPPFAQVLIVPLLAGFFGKGVKPFVWLSVLAAFVGVGLLEHSGTEFGVGDIWSFASAVFFGIQVFRTEIVSRRLPYRATLPLMSIVMFTIAGCAGVVAAAANVDSLAHFASNPLDLRTALLALPWLAILYTGLLSTDVALVCEVRGGLGGCSIMGVAQHGAAVFMHRVHVHMYAYTCTASPQHLHSICSHVVYALSAWC